MDQLLILIVFLVVMAGVLLAIVLPIVALVISIRSRRKLTETISKLEARQPPLAPGVLQQSNISGEGSLPAAIQQLQDRLERLEAALTARSIPIPEALGERLKPVTEETAERSVTESAPRGETPMKAQPPPPVATDLTPVGSAEPSVPVLPGATSTGPIRKIQSERIESIIGRR